MKHLNMFLILTGLFLTTQSNALAGDSLSLRDTVRGNSRNALSPGAPGRGRQEAMRLSQAGTRTLLARRAAMQRSLVAGLPDLRVAILSQGRQIALGSLVSDAGFVVARHSLLPGLGSSLALTGRLHGGLVAPLSVAAVSQVDDLALLNFTFAGGTPILPAVHFASTTPSIGMMLRASVNETGVPAFGTVAAYRNLVPLDSFPVSRLKASAIHQHASMAANQRQGGSSVSAIETDLNLAPGECGAPVFNPDGHLVGIALSREDSASTCIVPAGRIRALMEKCPQSRR